jgi:hypothetical protein
MEVNMALKTTYENAQDIPEGMETLYTESEGTFNLTGVDGLVDKGRLDEFRDNNIQLRKDMETSEAASRSAMERFEEQSVAMKALEEKFSEVNLEEWNSLQNGKKAVEDKAQALADKKLIESGDVDTLINQRVEEVLAVKTREFETMKSEYESKVSGLETHLTNYDGRLATLLVDNEITRFATEHGVRTSALEDVLYRGRGLFRVEEGQAVALDNSGRKVYADDAVTPLTISGWLGGLSDTAPHLFEASTGAGSIQPVAQPTQVKRESVSTHEMLLQGLSNIGME